MLVWIIGVITLSAILIFLIHQVYEYLKKSFSKPIERNIVNEAKTHYEQIYSTLASSRHSQPITSYLPQQPVYHPEPVTEIYANTSATMADELMDFVNDLDNDDVPFKN
jgi:beta-lactamase regulating signal transducer with metallopeptidase domain